ncbi:MAG: EamA family transporter [Desulfitobacteriaceae bacterium]|nr:EamA family transporter [Desulfitobacteriaceae bacterium]MDI6914333.1 EamA family transporter [Desulfitobacteriaceae bacterium]
MGLDQTLESKSDDDKSLTKRGGRSLAVIKGRRKHLFFPILAGSTTAVVWGISFLFTKDALNYTFPTQILGLRFAAAVLALLILQGLGIIRMNFKGKPLGTLILLGFFQPFLYFIGETWGVKWTNASEAGMIIGLMPVATALLAVIFLRERIRFVQALFIVSSVAGVFVIISAQGRVAFGEHVWGIAALFIAVLSTAIYSILSKKSSQHFTPVEITYVMMWIGAILFNLLGIGQSITLGTLGSYLAPLLKPSVIIAVLYLGVISSVGGFFLFNYALSRLSVSQSAPLINLTTVVSVLGGVILQGDPFSGMHAVGVALIVAGVWGTNTFSR